MQPVYVYAYAQAKGQKNFLCPHACIHACNEWKSD